jgi:hypothetical protein
VHFGNDGKNIRKFRQTVRDAWERHVSAVYPEARADFDTTQIKLYASPAPLQQRLVRGAHLTLADDNGAPAPAAPPASDRAEPAGIPTQFMAAFARALGPADARAWLKDASLEPLDGGWVLVTASRFLAHWIASHFDQALRHAAAATGLEEAPQVRARTPLPPS